MAEGVEKWSKFFDIGEKVLVGLVLPMLIFGAKLHTDNVVLKTKVATLQVQVKEGGIATASRLKDSITRLEAEIKELRKMRTSVQGNTVRLAAIQERLRSASERLKEIKDLLRGKK